MATLSKYPYLSWTLGFEVASESPEYWKWASPQMLTEMLEIFSSTQVGCSHSATYDLWHCTYRVLDFIDILVG